MSQPISLAPFKVGHASACQPAERPGFFDPRQVTERGLAGHLRRQS
jgi:hypothetical protein